MAVTQKDIAEHLGISRSNVRDALQARPRVAKATVERVVRAARELGYSAQSNQAARSLVASRYGSKAKKDTFAVLMSPAHGHSTQPAPYFIPIFDGLQQEADDLGLDLFRHTLRVGHMPRAIGDFMVDGVIAFVTTFERNEFMHEHGLPQVLIDSSYEGINAIYADHVRGISLTTQHLIDLGHRRIAYFAQKCPIPCRINEARYKSFADTLASNAISVDTELVWRDCERLIRESATETMTQTLSREQDFTAVVCYNDLSRAKNGRR